jgi:hypothetical protein
MPSEQQRRASGLHLLVSLTNIALSCECWCNAWRVGAQDVSGGAPVAVEGTDLPLWGMEVDVERARADIRVWPAQAPWLLHVCSRQGS